ncbi:uncharacterized protein PV07_04781 [Cladophialophora immunda]|uniref:Zn(2)-C6 fungal-type domain-containing protein n=1 Tax=Cladophialophora immunda TaxID=569365 RepID=A0A0D2CZD5_9EURO|nr:uncharacterized protein PV07_04781 [Cladophialophora immunda]KIW28929.1 hypothetical protein PV07_04781 [Cladophialophora immunda]
MPARSDVPKCSVACHYCRLKKTKCTGTRPCANCIVIKLVDEKAHREQCVFPDQSVGKKRSHSQIFLEERVASLEQLLRQETSQRSPTTASSGPIYHSDDHMVQQPNPKSVRPSVRPQSLAKPLSCRSDDPPNGSVMGIPRLPAWGSSSTDAATATIFDLHDLAPSDANLPQTGPILDMGNESHHISRPAPGPVFRAQSQQTYSPARQGPSVVATDDAIGSTIVVEDTTADIPYETPQSPEQEGDNQEHIGRASFLSLCSPLGVDWVCRQLGNSDFHNCASRLAITITRSLKMTRPLSIDRQPDPDYETAMLWASAYFEESIEHTLGLVPRQAFESRLQQHYSQPASADADFTWYSLRNTVFAIGSRLALGRGGGPVSYAAAQGQSWLYFENALAVHTNLVYMYSDVSAIECILLMALYCEGVSAPSLEYMLLSTAIRLAFSKRLHLQPPSRCSLSDSEKATRIWLLWVMYLYDKHIACRSGRPSMIRDDDINVALPTEPRYDTHTDLGLLIASVRHAQISYAIERELFSTKSRPRSIEEISKTVKRLDADLRAWYADLRQEYLLHTPDRPKVLHPRISHVHFLFLQHCFHGSLCVLHSVLAQPWREGQLQQRQSAEYAKQVRESAPIIADASRAIVLDSQKFAIDASTPAWLMFYFPVLAAANLFLNTVRSPTNTCAQSDVTLIEIVAGMFARLDYASGGHLSISFPREVAEYARGLLSKSRERNTDADSSCQWTTELDKFFPAGTDISADDEFTNADIVDFGYYEWPLMPNTG